MEGRNTRSRWVRSASAHGLADPAPVDGSEPVPMRSKPMRLCAPWPCAADGPSHAANVAYRRTRVEREESVRFRRAPHSAKVLG